MKSTSHYWWKHSQNPIYVQVYTEKLKELESKLTNAELAFLLKLAVRMDMNDHRVWVQKRPDGFGGYPSPGPTALAQELGESREAVSRKLKRLVEVGAVFTYPIEGGPKQWGLHPDVVSTTGGRLGPTYREWRASVLERDEWKCTECGNDKREDLHVHHIKPWQSHPHLRFDENNGITLCKDCHKKKHPHMDRHPSKLSRRAQ